MISSIGFEPRSASSVPAAFAVSRSAAASLLSCCGLMPRAVMMASVMATRSASSLSTILSKMGSRIDRFFTVRRTSGRKRRKSWPSELASDVRATSASRLSSFTGPSRTRTNGWTTAEA